MGHAGVTDWGNARPGWQARGDVSARPRKPVGAVGGLQVALGEHRLDVAIRCRRSDRPAPPLDLPAARRADIHRRRPLAVPPPSRALHSEVRGRRLRDRRRRRIRPRCRAGAVRRPEARSHAVRRRVADDSNPCARADPRPRSRKRFDQRFASGGLGPRIRDRCLPDVLPGHREHAPRPALGGSLGARADALLRGSRLDDPVEARGAICAALHLHGAEDRGDGKRGRRDHR